MTHYMKLSDKHFQIEMFCSHPNLKNNNSGSIKCNGNCEVCDYGKAELSIEAVQMLIHAAGATKS